MKTYRVTLTAEERQQLQAMIAAGKAAAKALAHARIRLKADEAGGGPAWPDDRIAEALEVSVDTVERERARRIAEGLEIHHTPVHGSWLNMAEIELAVLASQCLDRRIGSREELEREVADWEEARNERQVEVQWQFTTADARIKLRRLYPAVQTG